MSFESKAIRKLTMTVPGAEGNVQWSEFWLPVVDGIVIFDDDTVTVPTFEVQHPGAVVQKSKPSTNISAMLNTLSDR